MISSVIIAIVAPIMTTEVTAVWPDEIVAPTQAVIVDNSATSGSLFLFTNGGSSIAGNLDSDWYQRVESLYGLLVPLDTFPSMQGIIGGGKASLDLGGGRDTVTQTMTNPTCGAVVRVSVEVFTGEGAATSAFYEKTTDEDVWKDAPHWDIAGLARVSKGENVKTLVALSGRTCFEVTFARKTALEIDNKKMTAVAYSVVLRAAHNSDFTGVTGVSAETVVLENGATAPAKRVNGTLYVAVSDLVANGIECVSTINENSKFCVISLSGGDTRVDQFAWKAKRKSGAQFNMGAPAIPYDGDLWVPASVVTTS